MVRARRKYLLFLCFLAGAAGAVPQGSSPLHTGKATNVTLQFSKNTRGEIEVQTLLPIHFRVELESGGPALPSDKIQQCQMYNVAVGGRLEARIRCGMNVYRVTGYIVSRE